MPNVILMRHGHAMPVELDMERGLSETGKLETVYVADLMATDGLRVDLVLHSGKKRALETARILAERIGPEASLERRAGLFPHDDVGEVTAELAGAEADTAVVGHLPHLEYLIARLLGGEKTGTLGTSHAVHLVRKEGVWSLVGRYAPHR